MTPIEQIRSEIEWNATDMKEARANLISCCYDWERGKKTTLLPIVAVRARYFLEHIILQQSSCPILSDDLEEAARQIVIKMHPCLKDCTILGDRLTRGQLMALVKAGAQWQKEQMMKDAVEGEVADLNGDIYNYCIEKGMTDEDKVCIIIIKEDIK